MEAYDLPGHRPRNGDQRENPHIFLHSGTQSSVMQQWLIGSLIIWPYATVIVSGALGCHNLQPSPAVIEALATHSHICCNNGDGKLSLYEHERTECCLLMSVLISPLKLYPELAGHLSIPQRAAHSVAQVQQA
ncbi:hypothetical protein CEXT_348361 [Caerostris extrusa]|uniref:Uncharacterized protein n=1 Tax=Caerostris extrusa TaxID=172846 RepID=A0AAV4PQK0_CAEEX|nr:hypothetical protein CEXT_348361 [Caerostris extrusa]